MGLLSVGTPMKWSEAKQYVDEVRRRGIQQFISAYERLKDRERDALLWGDEVEYMVVDFDEHAKTAKLTLRAEQVLEQLQGEAMEAERLVVFCKLRRGEPAFATWHPEYARYMIESTPADPYGSSVKDLLSVESNMRERREKVRQYLEAHEHLMSITSFPRLGAGEFLKPDHAPHGPVARSLFVPDELINSHPRFATLTKNIRMRRGRQVAINVPIFKDTRTESPFRDPAIRDPRCSTQMDFCDDHVYMDAMVFGMGCCCLQMTFQACSINEARRLYDQLAVLAPVTLAMTAASPIHRGYLVDTDCRWSIISASVDDRTPEERGLQPLQHDRFVINKSRYDSIDYYISTDPQFRPEYNDLALVYDSALFDHLVAQGIDERLAKHVAHLFIRDPLVIFREKLGHDDDAQSMDHFENLQSTNWRSMRFKPPPPNSPIGWRVEFRCMEVQLTDFENAAFCIFIVLITRAILSFNLNLYIPITKVDENMARSQKRSAVLNEKFHFRKNLFSDDLHDLDQFSIDEIINGKESMFPGLVPIVHSYLDTLHLDVSTRCSLSKYLSLVQKKASGELPTTAAWLRSLTTCHPDYQHDSVVNESVHFDLMARCRDIGSDTDACRRLLGGQH